jgi:hypothetical protein
MNALSVSGNHKAAESYGCERLRASLAGVVGALPHKPSSFWYDLARREPRPKCLSLLVGHLHEAISAALATEREITIWETKRRIAAFIADLEADLDARFPSPDLCVVQAAMREHQAECDANPEQMLVVKAPSVQNIERALPDAETHHSRLGQMITAWRRYLARAEPAKR